MNPHLSVLVVDDSAAMRRVLTAILNAGRHAVTVAEDVYRATALLKARTPDILLTDYTMPGLTGLDLVRRVRADATFDAMPILVVSSERDVRLKAGMEAAGANGWLPKPICAATLLGLLDAMSDRTTRTRRPAQACADRTLTALAS